MNMLDALLCLTWVDAAIKVRENNQLRNEQTKVSFNAVFCYLYNLRNSRHGNVR